MREGGISIWFFISIALLVDGAVIMAAAIWEWIKPPANPVVLFHLHAGVWWGGLLFVLGLYYTFQFSPRRKTF